MTSGHEPRQAPAGGGTEASLVLYAVCAEAVQVVVLLGIGFLATALGAKPPATETIGSIVAATAGYYLFRHFKRRNMTGQEMAFFAFFVAVADLVLSLLFFVTTGFGISAGALIAVMLFASALRFAGVFLFLWLITWSDRRRRARRSGER